MSNVPIKTGSGGTANVSTTTLPNGDTAINHVTINADGTVVSPAQDATLQLATTALQTLASTLTASVKADPGLF